MPRLLAEFVQHRHLAVAGAHAPDGPHFAGEGVIFEFGAEDVFRRHDALERRHHHFTRRGRDHVEGELVTVDAALQCIDERATVRL